MFIMFLRTISVTIHSRFEQIHRFVEPARKKLRICSESDCEAGTSTK